MASEPCLAIQFVETCSPMPSESLSQVDPKSGAEINREFEGRVALVTGAAGAGIGQAVARRLAAGGATLVADARCTWLGLGLGLGLG